MDDLSSSRVFDILLRLTQQQFFRGQSQVLLTTIFCEHADLRRVA